MSPVFSIPLSLGDVWGRMKSVPSDLYTWDRLSGPYASGDLTPGIPTCDATSLYFSPFGKDTTAKNKKKKNKT